MQQRRLFASGTRGKSNECSKCSSIVRTERPNDARPPAARHPVRSIKRATGRREVAILRPRLAELDARQISKREPRVRDGIDVDERDRQELAARSKRSPNSCRQTSSARAPSDAGIAATSSRARSTLMLTEVSPVLRAVSTVVPKQAIVGRTPRADMSFDR
jgi:hypothetical protein